MFADVVASSKLTAGHQKAAYRAIIDEAVARLERRPTTLCVKDTGDGLVAAFANATEAAEGALRLRDAFMQEDWSRVGIPDGVAVRIGLHVGTIALTEKEGRIIDLFGAAVDLTARIEQSTAPNQVSCSAAFGRTLEQEGPRNLRVHTLGNKELPKNAGAFELFWLGWHHEAEPGHQASAPSNSSADDFVVPRGFSDRDKADFLDQAFEEVRTVLEENCRSLEASNAHVSTRFKRVHSEKLFAEIYVDGRRRTGCKIWISRTFSPEGVIAYHEGTRLTDDDNSYNEFLSVETDGRRIYLRPSFFARFSMNEQDREDLSPREAAQFLWRRLVQPLGMQ